MTAPVTSIQITGIHPYADEFPMASEAELEELTDSIATVGLIHPVVVTPQGLVLDGRNRLEACTRAEIEATIKVREGSDDDYKEFVIGVNTTGRRESMTVQIAAASTALVLGEEKRNSGRWRRGTINEDLRLSHASMKKALEQTGLVLDILGRDALREVRDGGKSLNAAYEFAIAKRDEQRLKLEEQKRIEAEEADAKSFVEQSAPDLALQVGDVFETYAEAQAVWEKRNREEADRISKDKAEKARKVAEAEQVRSDRYTDICQAILTASSWGAQSHGDVPKLMAEYDQRELNPPQIGRYLELEHLHHAKALVDGLITWKKGIS